VVRWALRSGFGGSKSTCWGWCCIFNTQSALYIVHPAAGGILDVVKYVCRTYIGEHHCSQDSNDAQVVHGRLFSARQGICQRDRVRTNDQLSDSADKLQDTRKFCFLPNASHVKLPIFSVRGRSENAVVLRKLSRRSLIQCLTSTRRNSTPFKRPR